MGCGPSRPAEHVIRAQRAEQDAHRQRQQGGTHGLSASTMGSVSRQRAPRSKITDNATMSAASIKRANEARERAGTPLGGIEEGGVAGAASLRVEGGGLASSTMGVEPRRGGPEAGLAASTSGTTAAARSIVKSLEPRREQGAGVGLAASTSGTTAAAARSSVKPPAAPAASAETETPRSSVLTSLKEGGNLKKSAVRHDSPPSPASTPAHPKDRGETGAFPTSATSPNPLYNRQDSPMLSHDITQIVEERESALSRESVEEDYMDSKPPARKSPPPAPIDEEASPVLEAHHIMPPPQDKPTRAQVQPQDTPAPHQARKQEMMKQMEEKPSFRTPSSTEALINMHAEARRRTEADNDGASTSSSETGNDLGVIAEVDSRDVAEEEEKKDEKLAAAENKPLPNQVNLKALANDSKRKLLAKEESEYIDASSPSSSINHRSLRKPIAAAPIRMTSEFVAPIHPKSTEDGEFIRRALEGNFVFSSLGNEEAKSMIDAFEDTVVEEGDKVIVQGSVGDYFYVLAKGEVKFEVDGRDVGTVGPGGTFGELALLYDCPRAATCEVSKGPAELWRVDQNTFRKILASATMKNDNEVRDVLRKVSFLKDLDERYLNKISEALSEMNYVKGEKIVRKGAEGNVFYIIKSGKVRVHDIEVGKSKYDDQVLERGAYFGERAIVTRERRVANITALEDCTLLCLSKDDFRTHMGDLETLINKTDDKRKLDGIPMLKQPGVRNDELSSLADLIEDVNYPKGHSFYSDGEVVTSDKLCLYIIRSGTINITDRRGDTMPLSHGGFFGDDNIAEYMDNYGADVVADDTVVAANDCRVGMLTLKNFEKVLGNMRNLKKREKERVSQSVLDRKIRMTDLKKHRILGTGTFGTVWLVSRISDRSKRKRAYALKAQYKREILEYNQVDGVMREKNIMDSLHSPFIIKLCNTYQDHKSLYMLLQLVQGGELFSVIHTARKSGISEASSKFYAANILEGLSYMHRRNIIYRDLKPENVLVDEGGFTVIIDLGFAKTVMDKTYTFCGTPLYIAPEVVLSRGHDRGADYWSWGILIYEMISGTTPFYGNGIDQNTLFRKIVHGAYKFPKNMMSPAARDLVKKLLVVRPANRMGSLAGGDKDIRKHEWFADLDFERLVKKELRTPWLPEIKDALDVSNFNNQDHHPPESDKYHRPLSEKEQRLFKDF